MLVWSVATLGSVAFAHAAEIGPDKGTLVIVGGGAGPDILKQFVELAGGPDAPLVVIPTAQGARHPTFVLIRLGVVLSTCHVAGAVGGAAGLRFGQWLPAVTTEFRWGARMLDDLLTVRTGELHCGPFFPLGGNPA